ncbi:GNAT family N-acetyltransferase [Treponema porcinum]|uniref:Protein N-acetyltransferase, RimJ/RimL family n=1 Tax=Treponema porcinum TaxID=261392 RepID=A0A1T4LJC9_TREPO|nr:GNAT family N-acetyltransferase [Treponema porcinum]SJZ54544.1 Protein N-acetyltransferase, RimJ/RimL family [Treponema porcinum]
MRFFLREVKLEDGKNIVNWRNNRNVITHCIDKTLITEESNERFYHEYVETGRVKQFIIERSDEELGGGYPIGTIYLKDIDTQKHICELGMYPSEDTEWNSESQKFAVISMVNRAIDDYGMMELFAFVIKNCVEEKEVLQKAGFVLDDSFRSPDIERFFYKRNFR